MFSDIHAIVRACGVCASRGRKPPKQKIQGHVRCDVPGEMWMLDVLHLPQSQQGNQYILTMIDVASRWAYLAPLAKIDSASIVRAVEHHIIGDGIFPKMFITDNGSEFKKDFTDFCTVYNIKAKKSVPHHAEGHGIVEAMNRTISDVLGHMIEEDGGDWEEHLPWARRAYLSSPHTAIQSGSVGLSPAEAFRGWAVQPVLSLPDMDASVDKDSPMRERHEKVKDNLERAMIWMKESRIDYERLMEDTKRNVNRRNRVFSVGDKVRLYNPARHKKDKKIGRVFVGPYLVEEVVKHHGLPSEYVVRREGGQGHKTRATIEQLRSYVDTCMIRADQTRGEMRDRILLAPSREYEVERILDEKGSMKEGTKEYFVKWKGDYDFTWEPEALINAPDLITEFHMKKYRSKKSEIAAIAQGNRPPSIVNEPPEAKTISIQMNLLDYTPSELLARLARHGVKPEDIFLIWASPPCRTFSPADRSNISRNNNFRDHNLPNKPPTSTNPEKGRIAREHDLLVQHLFDIVEYNRAIGMKFKFALENPRGSLECQEYMQIEELPSGTEKVTFDQCTYEREYKKTTQLWHDLEGYKPTGSTGDGRCHGRCGKGYIRDGYYRHFKALAVEPFRGPRGKGHTKEKNALPEDLLEEIALHAMHRGENRQGKVIVDLCAGYQSWAPVAERLGCTYVAIDLLGDRNVTHHKRMGHRKIALTTRVEESKIPELTMEELEELEVLIRTELGDQAMGKRGVRDGDAEKLVTELLHCLS